MATTDINKCMINKTTIDFYECMLNETSIDIFHGTGYMEPQATINVC
jgi:hypothetical protein